MSALTRLATVALISPTGDAMATTALILHVQRTAGTGTAVAALLFAEAAPPLLSPLTGTIADRTNDRRKLLAVCLAAQAVLVAIIAATLPPLAVIAALIFARATFEAVGAPTTSALVPAIVGDTDLQRANSILTGAREAGAVVGPPLAGLLFVFANGPRVALFADSATFVVAAVLVLALPPAGPRNVERAAWRTDVADGLRYMWRTPAIRAIAIGFWIVVLATAADDLILAFLGARDLHASPFAIGVLLAAASVGLLLGLPLVRPAVRVARGLMPAAVLGMVIAAAGNVGTAIAPTIALAFAAQAVRGIGIPMLDTSVRTFIQRRTPAPLLGRTLANVYGGVSVAAALGYVYGGPLLDATSPRVAFAVVGIGGLLAAAATALLVRGASHEQDDPERGH
jgi:MFS family permease